MRVLIVDDELPARAKLRRLLQDQPDIAAIFEAADGFQALELTAAEHRDVIFLDIQMPEITGLEVAASLPAPAPLIVFVTAYDQYAIRAFDANATDYLLKPYDQVRLGRALQRVRERLQTQGASTPALAKSVLETDQKNSAAALPALRQLLISERGLTRVIKIDEIQWLETANNYVVLHTADTQPLLRQTLTALLEKLGADFVRCHRRAAVRCDQIASIIAQGKGDAALLLHGCDKVPCSRQYRAAVVAALAAQTH
jgi:two-component system LytT family response regulator